MIDREEITGLIDRSDPFGRERELTRFRLEMAQALALVRIGDLLEKLITKSEELEGGVQIVPPLIPSISMR